MAYKKIVDISTFDRASKPIDFNLVKQTCYGTIIRCGYGADEVDEDFFENINGALKAGMAVGIYWFSYAYSIESVKREADFFLKLIAPYKDKITLGVWFDYEYASWKYAVEKTGNMNNKLLNEMAVAWCDIVGREHEHVGIYYNSDWRRSRWEPGVLGRYLRWQAAYNDTLPATDIQIWQYSSSDEVPGIFTEKEDVNWLIDDSWITGDKPSDNKIIVDGSWGAQTTSRAQAVFGTLIDGVVSDQYADAKGIYPACYWQWRRSPSYGSALIRAIQRKLKDEHFYKGIVDGIAGQATAKAMQSWLAHLGFYHGAIDGVFGVASVKAFQEWLNSKA